MIKVTYSGRLGNNMFQYALGRIIAEEIGAKLIADPLPFPKTYDNVDGYCCNHNPEVFKDHILDLDKIINNHTQRKIELQGWFQCSKYYLPFMDKIKKWYDLPPHTTPKLENVNDSDALIYIRLGDYFSKIHWSLSYQFYEKAIELASPRQIYIVTEDPNHPFIEKFKRYKPILLSNSSVSDMMLGKLFNKIVISCSTFSWWAAILSNAQEIYFPLGEKGFWSRSHRFSGDTPDGYKMDLRVDDPRFIYFYNTPLHSTKRISKGLVDFSTINSDAAKFHRQSKAYWFD